MIVGEHEQSDEAGQDDAIRVQTRTRILEAYKAAHQVRRIVM